MPFFIVPMLAGLAGLVVMALPGLSRHGGGHTHAGHGGHVGHAGHAGHGLRLAKGSGHGAGHAGAGHAGVGHAGGGHVAPLKGGPAATGHVAPLKGAGHTHAIPHVPHAPHASHAAGRHTAAPGSHSLLEILDPRLLFSLMALFGASGQIGVAAGLGVGWAATLAVPAAAGLEWAIVGRLWRFAMRFEGQPSSPLETLLYEEVEAVTQFHNGKGMVRAVKDGRSVQLMAVLDDAQAGDPVKTGDRLSVLDVDSENERVTVTRI